MDEATGLYDYGARYYDPAIARWGQVDPASESYSNISPYSYALNTPINAIDIAGKWAIYIHFSFTKRALKKAGFSGGFSSSVGHYASVYSDNPYPRQRGLIMGINKGLAIAEGKFGALRHLRFKSGIDYSSTQDSQSARNNSTQKWHGTRTDRQANDGVTAAQAVSAAQSFGWGNIFEAGNSDNVDEAVLGQGFHALQDAERHKGVVYSETSADNEHSLMGDVFGSRGSSRAVSKSAAKIFGLLQGETSGLGKRENLYVPGMNIEQISQVLLKLSDQGYEASYKSNKIKAVKK